MRKGSTGNVEIKPPTILYTSVEMPHDEMTDPTDPPELSELLNDEEKVKLLNEEEEVASLTALLDVSKASEGAGDSGDEEELEIVEGGGLLSRYKGQGGSLEAHDNPNRVGLGGDTGVRVTVAVAEVAEGAIVATGGVVEGEDEDERYVRIRQIFDLMDADLSGTVTKEEMLDRLKKDEETRAALGVACSLVSEGVPDYSLFEKMFDDIDDDGSGEISWEVALREYTIIVILIAILILIKLN